MHLPNTTPCKNLQLTKKLTVIRGHVCSGNKTSANYLNNRLQFGGTPGRFNLASKPKWTELGKMDLCSPCPQIFCKTSFAELTNPVSGNRPYTYRSSKGLSRYIRTIEQFSTLYTMQKTFIVDLRLISLSDTKNRVCLKLHSEGSLLSK